MNNNYAARVERFLATLFPKQNENITWYGLSGVYPLGITKNVEIELIAKATPSEGLYYTGFKVSIIHLKYGLVQTKNFFFSDFFAELQGESYNIVLKANEVIWGKAEPTEEQTSYLEEKIWNYANEWK